MFFLVLLDGVHSKPKGINSAGNAPFDLIITTLTSIFAFEKNVITNNSNDPELMISGKTYKDLQEAVNDIGPIVIEGFLKFSIKITSMPGNMSICQGCLADVSLKYIIELRLKTIQVCDIAVGTHIKVKGEIIRSSYSRPYLLIQDVTDIIIVPDNVTKTRLQMVQAKITPALTVPSFKKIKIESENSS